MKPAEYFHGIIVVLYTEPTWVLSEAEVRSVPKYSLVLHNIGVFNHILN